MYMNSSYKRVYFRLTMEEVKHPFMVFRLLFKKYDYYEIISGIESAFTELARTEGAPIDKKSVLRIERLRLDLCKVVDAASIWCEKENGSWLKRIRLEVIVNFALAVSIAGAVVWGIPWLIKVVCFLIFFKLLYSCFTEFI